MYIRLFEFIVSIDVDIRCLDFTNVNICDNEDVRNH